MTESAPGMTHVMAWRELSAGFDRAAETLGLTSTEKCAMGDAVLATFKGQLQALNVPDNPVWQSGEHDGRDVYVLTDPRKPALPDGSTVTRYDGTLWVVEWSMFRGDAVLHSMRPAGEGI